MKTDHINGLFEAVGGVLLLLNCWRMYRDKEVKGVSLAPCFFFTAWSYWNLIFYPSVGAWWSFAGGIIVVSTNTLWLIMIGYYKSRTPPKDAEKP